MAEKVYKFFILFFNINTKLLKNLREKKLGKMLEKRKDREKTGRF